jgi:hypothetical protein
MSARCAGADLEMRRKIDQVVYETRVSLANTFNKFADEAKEPPLEQAPTTDSLEEDDVAPTAADPTNAVNRNDR